MFKKPLRNRVHWTRLSLVILLSLAVGIIGSIQFPLESLLLGPLLLAILTFTLQKASDFKLWTEYPEELQVYYLHMLDKATLTRVLGTRRDATYVSNPVISMAEKQVEDMKLGELFEMNRLVTGSRGAGKSTTLWRMTGLLRDLLKRRLPSWKTRLPGPFHPKLVILAQPTRMAKSPNQVPRFTEPVVLVADDLQKLDHPHLGILSEKLAYYANLHGHGVLLCAHEKHMDFDIQSMSCFPRTGSKEHMDYIHGLVGAISSDYGITVPDSVLDKLVQRVVDDELSPLYIMALMEDLNRRGEKQLIDELLEEIPKELKRIYKDDWKKRTPTERSLIESVRLLQEIEFPADIEILSILYRILHEGVQFDRTLSALSRTIWIDVEGLDIHIPEGPYESVFKRYSQLGSIYELTDLITHLGDNEKARRVLRYARIEELVRSLGLFFGTHVKDPKSAQACFELVISQSSDDTMAHYNLGIAYWAQGESEKAEKTLERAIELRPDFADAWLMLGLLNESMGHTAEAEAAYNKTRRLSRWMGDIKLASMQKALFADVAGVEGVGTDDSYVDMPSHDPWWGFDKLEPYLGGPEEFDSFDPVVVAAHIQSSNDPWEWTHEVVRWGALPNDDIMKAIGERIPDIIQAIQSGKVPVDEAWRLIEVDVLRENEEFMTAVSKVLESGSHFYEHLSGVALSPTLIADPTLQSALARRIRIEEDPGDLISLVRITPELGVSKEIQEAIESRTDGIDGADI